MAYITASQVSAIRAALKTEFPKIKFSVTSDRSSVNISIMSSDIDFAPLSAYNTNINAYNVYKEDLDECYTERDIAYQPFAAFFNKLVKIAKSQDWYDKSDAMTDYFNTAYYINLRVGKWDKPYVLKA